MELLHAMKVFIRLAELGSFTKVAEAMDTGRPAVTRTIQELEASLGVRLFHRTTRAVKLTSEGERFYEQAKGILSDVARATSMFGSANGMLQGRLRIDIPSAFSQRSFFESLKRFSDAHPQIDLVVGVSDRTVDLVAEGVDCVLRIGDLPDSSLVAHAVGAAVMVTCAAPGYLAAYGTPESPQALPGHRYVTFLSGESGRPLLWDFADGNVDFPSNSRGVITVNDSTAYLQCGLAGFGIIQAPGVTVADHLANGELVEILKSARPRQRRVSVLYPSRTHLAPQVLAFATWLREQFPVLHPAWFVTR